jgi:acyl-CoA synthetase (AMP-forming)/AMP-acid ligase II/serine acetyltransferase
MAIEIDKVKSVNLSQTLGVVETNSVDYVRVIFDALERGQIAVPLRTKEDNQRINTVNVQDIISPESGGGWLQPSLQLSDSDDIAHVSFTSGTEGLPKGVLLSRLALNDTVRRIQSLMQMDQSVREYIGVPVYHSFGYGRCRHVASVGGCFYIPESGFDPRELSRMLAAGEVNALSLVPSLLRILINETGLLGEECLQLKWLEIGSQAMTAKEKQQVKELFPNARIVQHYGLTEASRTTLLQIDGAQSGVLESVGRAYGDVELSVNDDGRICIRGSHLASQIINGQDVTPVLNDQAWFETSDLGDIDDDGYLFFQGRADNVVNCGGHKLSTETLELAILRAFSSVDDLTLSGEVAVSRIDNSLYGEGFLLSYTSADDLEPLKQVATQCVLALGIRAKSAVCFFFVPALPKTATGKTQYKQLSLAYSEQMRASASGRTSIDQGQGIVGAFARVLGISPDEFAATETVTDIGIDSLQSVQLAIQLEAMLGYLPADWRQTPIEVLSQLPKRAPDTEKVKSTGGGQKAPPLWDGSSNRNPENIGFRALLKEDFITHDRDLFSQGLFALFVNRFGNWRMGVKTKLFRFPLTVIYRVLIKMAQIFCGIKLDYTVNVGRRVKLEHFGGMILGARSIGDDAIIRQNTTLGIRDISDLSAKPIIEHGVNIGAGAVIVGNITVGRHSVIGPNCVVTEDLPPFSVVSVGALVITNPE